MAENSNVSLELSTSKGTKDQRTSHSLVIHLCFCRLQLDFYREFRPIKLTVANTFPLLLTFPIKTFSSPKWYRFSDSKRK